MLIPTFIGITLLTFILIHSLPGDPVLAQLGDRQPTPEQYEQMKIALGLDQPYWKQYLIYINNILHGDFGRSFVSAKPVITEFFDRFPATLQLSVSATFFALFWGIPIGVLAALNRGKLLDNILMSVALVGYSMPVFWWGLVLVMFFAVNLGWLPVSGYYGVQYYFEPVTGFSLIDAILASNPEGFLDALTHMVLPTIVLGTIPMAIIARMTRSSMLEILGDDFMRSLKARGLSPWRLVVTHGLRNALIPIVTSLGLIVGGLVSGSILTENIFSWPGIGKWLIDAINSRDFPIVQGAIFFIAVFVVLINFVVDVLYTVINPRAK